MKLTIGAVCIYREGEEETIANSLSGDERHAALLMFKDTGYPPHGFKAVSFNPRHWVVYSDVNWETL